MGLEEKMGKGTKGNTKLSPLTDKELLRVYLENNQSLRKSAIALNVDRDTLKREFIRREIKYRKEPQRETIEELSPEEIKIAKELKNRGIYPKQVKTFIRALESRESEIKSEYRVGKNKVRIGVFGDQHIGNIHYDRKFYDFMIEQFKKEKVDFILNTGDILDGWYTYSKRQKGLFEQNAIGLDKQLEIAVEDLKKLPKKMYFITGNHEYNTFMNNAGIEVGKYLEMAIGKDKVKFLGNGEGDVILKNGTKIKLLHPDGGSSYAISYKPQKIIESLESGTKPNLLLVGHFHKAEYLFYRNVHAYQTGTLCGQTKFMRGRGLQANKSFWIIDISARNKGQIDSLKSTLYPAYA